MHRPGADVHDMAISDFLCDFCGRAWDGAFPMVEGHQGSLICGACLTIAYTEVIRSDTPPGPASDTCTMCLEERDDPTWRSPAQEASICRRCIRQSGTKLEKDPDWPWTKPG